MKSPLLRMRRDAQVVDKNSFTPLEDAQGDHVSSNGCGVCLFVLSVFLALLKNLLLIGSFGLFDSSLFHVTACNDAGFEFVKFARSCLFGFEDKFEWDDEVSFKGSLSKDESVMVSEVLDFHSNCMQPGRADIVIKFEDSFQ